MYEISYIIPKMAKRRYRRYRRSKGRWSANIQTIQPSNVSAPANSSFYSKTTLCENPAQSTSTVSQQYTVKNIELNYQIESPIESFTNVENLCAYIMYVPQGMSVTETYPNTHPEYIMAYRYLGSPDVERGTTTSVLTPGRLPPKIRTRLARRLQTGDSIIFLLTGLNNTSSNSGVILNGLVRWWTKAN